MQTKIFTDNPWLLVVSIAFAAVAYALAVLFKNHKSFKALLKYRSRRRKQTLRYRLAKAKIRASKTRTRKKC